MGLHLPEGHLFSLTQSGTGWASRDLGLLGGWVLMAVTALYRSMLPDVIDDFHLKQPHSQGTEPIFFSFYVFFTKFASGVSLGISTLSLE